MGVFYVAVGHFNFKIFELRQQNIENKQFLKSCKHILLVRISSFPNQYVSTFEHTKRVLLSENCEIFIL